MREWRGYEVTSEFGERDNPLTKAVDTEFHKGVDLFISHQAPIKPFIGGLVLYAGEGLKGTGLGGYGICVALQVGEHCHVYGHFDHLPEGITRGKIVTSDQVIGYQGRTGNVAGSHVHFEIRKKISPSYGWSADPSGYIRPDTYIDSLLSPKTLTYQAHIQGLGWLPVVGENMIAGTEGQSLRMEALIVNLEDVNVQAHVQGLGWLTVVKSGQIAGTTGQSLRMEAVRIWLTGELAKTHDILYCAHVQGKGWLPWVKNNTDYAGTVGKSLRMEAIKIKLVRK